MDMNSFLGDKLCEFVENNNLKNAVTDFTRVATRVSKSNQLTTSKSLIDVLLHNGDFVDIAKVIGCPFSDHKFVSATLKLQAVRTELEFSSFTRISS